MAGHDDGAGSAAGSGEPSPGGRGGNGPARTRRRHGDPWRSRALRRAHPGDPRQAPPGRCSARACWWCGTSRSTATGWCRRRRYAMRQKSGSGQPLARVNTGATARRVEQITAVLSASVGRSWPDTIVITVRERTPQLAVAAARWLRPRRRVRRHRPVGRAQARRDAAADGTACRAARQPGRAGRRDRAAPAAVRAAREDRVGLGRVGHRCHLAPEPRGHGAVGRAGPGGAEVGRA